MLGHPVAENPLDRMLNTVDAYYGLTWQFWKNDIASEQDLALAIAAPMPLGYSSMAIMVLYKVAVIPLLVVVGGTDVQAIGAPNYITFEAGRLIGHNEGKGGVKAIEKVLEPGSGAPRTRDLGGTASTTEVGQAIARALLS